MKEASQSSRIPFSLNEAAIGIVPYMQSGEAIPRIHAGTIPKRLNFLLLNDAKRECIFSLQKTETNDPIAIPKSQ